MRKKNLATALAATCAALTGASAACHRTTDAERRASAQATEAAEGIAQEATLTSARLETDGSEEAKVQAEKAARGNAETFGAFQLEQEDYRTRLQRALDRLDEHIAHPRVSPVRRDAWMRELRARRDMLKADLEAVNRSTEQDWATLRTKVERELGQASPDAQVLPRAGRTPGEAP